MPSINRLRLPRHLAFIALLLPALVLAQGSQWTWRDKSGQVNASDRPPPRDIPDKDILSRPQLRRTAAPSPSASAASGVVVQGSQPVAPVDRDLEARRRAAEAEQKAKVKADEDRVAQQRADNCRRAREQQTTLDSGQRIARINEKGERIVMDDAARAEQLRQTRDLIASECR